MADTLSAAGGRRETGTTWAETDGPVARARTLSPFVRASAERTEQLGTLAPDVVAAMRDAGLFWITTPSECGGAGLDVLTLIETIETVSRADGSAGWVLMANCLITGLAGSYCDDDAVTTIFGGAQLPILAGMLGPGGRAREVEGGLEGSGTYSFGSGAAHADWLGAGMVLTDNGNPRAGAGGTPDVRVCIVPRSRIELLGNWDTLGLVGTGSYDYSVPQQFVPAGFTFARTRTEPNRGGSWFRIGIPGFSCAGHSAVALGIAARALEEIAVLSASKKRPAYPGPVGEHPIFRQDFSRFEATYQSMRAYTYSLYELAQDRLALGDDIGPELAQRFRQSATYVHQSAADIVRFCYTWGGSDSLRNPSALGRAMRDICAATQHVYVDPLTMVDAAPALAEGWRREHDQLR